MRILIFLLLLAGSALGQTGSAQLDNNTAFFEGANHNYIFYAPPNFVMNSTHATDDGLSLAFLPKDDKYSQAKVLIGVNFFRLDSIQVTTFELDKLIGEDSAAFRHHYGPKLIINAINPLVTNTGDSLLTFYLNDTTRFIPDVMLSYFCNNSEVCIFSLSIDESTLRFKAEDIFVNFINQIKILTIGKIEL